MSARASGEARGATFGALRERLEGAFSAGAAGPWPEQRFEALARAVFEWQYAASPTYRRFAEGRGVTPATYRGWRDAPAVPAAAFKHLALLSGGGGPPERIFRTSGTTAGRRGEHHVPSLSLYRASLLPTFALRLLPDGARPRFLSLIPSPELQPDSSLSTMVGEAMAAFGGEGSDWFASPDAGPDLLRFARALDRAEAEGAPVLVLGTAFAFVHWLDATAGERPRRLPPGSRLMETGGFKGRSRVVARERLYAALSARLGIPPEWMVNEYGMTELLSQYYEEGAGRPAAAESLGAALEARWLVPPPWMRFQVLDPVTLAPLADGEPGVLAHLDLANAGSVAAILTEDLGHAQGGRLRLLGRAPGAEPRGCSLAMDELMEAVGGP